METGSVPNGSREPHSLWLSAPDESGTVEVASAVAGGLVNHPSLLTTAVRCCQSAPSLDNGRALLSTSTLSCQRPCAVSLNDTLDCLALLDTDASVLAEAVRGG